MLVPATLQSSSIPKASKGLDKVVLYACRQLYSVFSQVIAITMISMLHLIDWSYVLHSTGHRKI